MYREYIVKNVKNLAVGLAVALLFFLVIEGTLWIVGVGPLSEHSDPYIGFSGYTPLFVEKTTENEERFLATSKTKMNWFNYQQFPLHKESGVTRIFCLGGSTTYGRPYDDKTSFCGWLREFLPAVDPSRKWEVINAGGISYASYRVTRLIETLVSYEPDIFIIYTGHNEFLENRTYDELLSTPEFLRDIASLASRLRLYSLLSDFLYEKKDMLTTEVDAILDKSVGPEDYHRDDEMRDAILDHFRISLMRMSQIGKKAGAELLFVTPASNIRDFSPFKAEPSADLDSASILQVGMLKLSITKCMDNQDPEQAAVLADQALAIDSRDAELLFYKGRALLALGQINEARHALIAARDEDIAPLRALTPIPNIVAEVALENGNGIFDFARMIEDSSSDGIPGEDFFLDHVHPTIEGNRMIALGIIDEMIKIGTAMPSPTWNNTAISKITERVKNSVDEAANAMALTNLSRVLTWAGKQQEAQRLVDRAASISMDHHTLFQKVTVLIRAGQYEEALPYSYQTVQLMPEIATVRRDHGILLAQLGYNDEARKELEIAAQLNPTMKGLYYHLGLVLSDLGHTDQAEKTYLKAIEIEPENANAYNNLGILLTQQGNLEKALPYSGKAARLMPEIAAVRMSHGFLLANLGHNKEALNELKAAARLNSTMTGLHYRMGLIFSELGDNVEAERMYRRAIEIEPENANACNNLGILLAQRGDLEEAMNLFERAVNADPLHRKALNNLERARGMLRR